MSAKQAVKTSEYVKKINVICCPRRGSQQWGSTPIRKNRLASPSSPMKTGVHKFINFHQADLSYNKKNFLIKNLKY